MYDQLIKNNRFSNIYLKCYALFLFLMIFTQDSQLNGSMYQSLANNIYNVVLILFILISLFLVLLNNSFNKLILSGILITILIFPNIFIKQQVITPFFLLIYIMIIGFNGLNINPYKFIKIDFFTRICSVVIIIIFSLLNIMPSNNNITFRNGFIRYAFGFDNPNGAGLTILSVMISLVLLLHFIKMGGHTYIIMLFLFIFSYLLILMTDSRESEVADIALFIFFLFNNVKFIKKIIVKLPVIIFALVIIFTMKITFFSNLSDNWFYYLNQLFTQRLSGWIISFEVHPIQWFGSSNISGIGKISKSLGLGASGLDNGYLMDLTKMGILGLILLSIFILYVNGKIELDKEYLACACSIIIFVVLVTVQYKEFYLYMPYFISLCYFKASSNKKLKID